MSTPKIKLYRLFPGYSSQNDNDIQSATNDQLLPVTLKNIMPTNAYTLVGVGEKILQALIPVINYSVAVTNVPGYECIYLGSGLFEVPTIRELSPFLIVNRTNLMPTFSSISTDSTFIYYKSGEQYIYVKDQDAYFSEEQSTQIKFILYFSQVQSKWYVKFTGQNVPANLYVNDMFYMLLKKVTVQNLHLKNSSTYYLSKSQGINQVDNNKHEFIPATGQFLSYHLRPKIQFSVNAIHVMSEQIYNDYYQSGGNLQENIVLKEEDGCFKVDQKFRLKEINNNLLKVSFGEGSYNLPVNTFSSQKNTEGNIVDVLCTLTYYTIPTFSDLSNGIANFDNSNGSDSSNESDSSFSTFYLKNQLNNSKLMFVSQQQDIYNGTRQAIKPNTLYLQLVISAPMQYVENNILHQNYTIESDSSTNTVTPKILEKSHKTNYCRGIIPRNSNSDVTIQNICGKFRYVYNKINDKDYVKTNYQDKKLTFPDSQYLLDVNRGLYYFRVYDKTLNGGNGGYTKKQFDDAFCKNNDYFFSTYYHRVQTTKLFVSDFQSWVTQHLRNNPDIFYGKQDYSGDDYIDANENSIKVGAIPRFLQRGNGYTIQFRNGAVQFASDTQDLDYIGETNQQQISTDQSTGTMKGGVARANFAYYNGLQNVLDQKLQLDTSYTGGGYKYRALTDKQYPDSIGRRWVKRDNPLQFIGASFVTQKLNDQGQLTTYNLPDLQTKQLQSLQRYGFTKCVVHPQQSNQQSAKIFLDYFITTNNFSYPFVFKISNAIKRLTPSSPAYATKTSSEKIKKRQLQQDKFDYVNPQEKFEQNQIYFETLQGKQLQHINVKFTQQATLPVLSVTIPVLTEKLPSNTTSIQILKNEQFSYGSFEIYDSNAQDFVTIDEDNISVLDENNKTKIFVAIPNYVEKNNLYLRYRMTTKLYRGFESFSDNIVLTTTNEEYSSSSSDESDSSDLSGYQSQSTTYIDKNYKIQKTATNQLIFSIGNFDQTTYFKLNVIDFNFDNGQYLSTIVYTIKKYDL